MAGKFAKYLGSVNHRYAEVRSLYTSTDAVRLKLEAQAWKREKSDDRHKEAEKEPPEPVIGLLKRLALGDEPEHVLLAGRPGSGKSTALRQLLLELVEAVQADESHPIPVLVQLKGDRTIPELIRAEFRQAKQRVTLEQIDDWLLNDRLALLLDGVNEIPSQELRTKAQEFREENSSTPMIFTTRDLSVGGTLGIEHRIEMRPLGELQMREFVQKYLEKRGLPEQVEQLLGQLRDRLREVAETPLLLKMLCDVFDPQTQQIPQNKGELFRLFDAKFDEFKGFASAPVSSDFRRFKSEMLQYLAFRMIQGDPQRPTEAWLTIERDRAEEWLEQLLSSRVDAPGQRAKQWLENLLEYHLLQVAANPRHIEFHHQLFQEYYAAEYLLKQMGWMDDHTLKREYLNYLKWTEMLSLMLALAEDDSFILRVIRLCFQVDLHLSISFLRFPTKISKQKLIELVEASSISEATQNQLLGEAEIEEAIPKLYELAKDSSDPEVSKSATTALACFQYDKRSPELNDFLENIGAIKVIQIPEDRSRKLSNKQIVHHFKKKRKSPFEELMSRWRGIAIADLLLATLDICSSGASWLLLTALFEILGRPSRNLDIQDQNLEFSSKPFSLDDFEVAASFLTFLKNQTVEIINEEVSNFLQTRQENEKDALATIAKLTKFCSARKIDSFKPFLILSCSARFELSEAIVHGSEPLLELTSISFSECPFSLSTGQNT